MNLDGFKNLTIEALQICNYESIIGECKPSTNEYLYKLSKAAQEAKNSENTYLAAPLQLLSLACSLQLRPSDRKQPFHPYIRTSEGCSVIPIDFPREVGVLLANFSLEVKDSELASRLGDLAWVICRNITAVKLAITKYIDASNNSYCSEFWNERIRRLERALRLALQIKDENKEYIIRNACYRAHCFG